MTRHCFAALKPFLVHCMWPDPGLYPMKRTHWNLEDAEVIRQYKLLCRRVKLVAAQTKGFPSDLLKQASGWCRQTSLVLRPVWSWGPLRSILHVLLQRIATEDFQLMDQWKAFSRFTAVVACSTILEFLGDLQMPCNAFYTFKVKPEQLAAVKLNVRRKRRKSADVCVGPLPVPVPLRWICPAFLPPLTPTSLLQLVQDPVHGHQHGMLSGYTTGADCCVGQKQFASDWALWHMGIPL